jgi:crotonobetainyl-CoA:carnitine CoA-transferase CaiB-like acyl-CoA transferase
MGPLDGVSVLEAGLLIQGPQAALTMQEWGADVVKIELPGFGDQSRWLPLARGDRRSAFFSAYNRGKRSMTVDLRVPRGRHGVVVRAGGPRRRTGRG